MDALDLRLRDQEFQSSLLVQHDRQWSMEQRFADVVLRLDFGKTTCSTLPFSTQRGKQGRYDLAQCLASLVKQGHVSDVIGPRVLDGKSVLHYSTLVSLQPKPYFSAYSDLSKRICYETSIPIAVWLEDLMSLPRLNWSIQAMQDATVSTREWFLGQGHESVMVNSQSWAGVVPLDFIKGTIGDHRMSEFLIMLPFHKHDSLLLSVGDVAHCLWSTYVFSCFLGLHLTATNSKRNYLLYRALCGKQYSVALLPRVI